MRKLKHQTTDLQSAQGKFVKHDGRDIELICDDIKNKD